jgi:hypothetical protein
MINRPRAPRGRLSRRCSIAYFLTNEKHDERTLIELPMTRSDLLLMEDHSSPRPR